jgi:hypothetical protein
MELNAIKQKSAHPFSWSVYFGNTAGAPDRAAADPLTIRRILRNNAGSPGRIGAGSPRALTRDFSVTNAGGERSTEAQIEPPGFL